MTNEARDFSARLLVALPELSAHVRRAHDETDLIVKIPSPNPMIPEGMWIWMDGGTEPSIAFGSWHTHSGLFEGSVEDCWGAIINLAKAILDDQFVIIRDVGGKADGALSVLDLREEDALAEELTSMYSPGTVDILSWSGAGDRTVSLHDLEYV